MKDKDKSPTALGVLEVAHWKCSVPYLPTSTERLASCQQQRGYCINMLHCRCPPLPGKGFICCSRAGG